MYLLVDIGNTRAKSALTDGKGNWEFQHPNADLLKVYEYYGVTKAIWLATGQAPTWLDAFQKLPGVERFTATSRSPLALSYQTPQTLGADRLAAAIGGYSHFPQNPLLLVDAGTALTCDFVHPTGTFEGGAISPGLAMRAEALHHYTASLPLVHPQALPLFTGQNTHQSIASGIWYGMLGEIQYRIDRYTEQNPDLVVILSGGDASLFESHLKGHIFARPNLVLEGLLEVLLYNAQS
jgi:type III pantothenate kinase